VDIENDHVGDILRQWRRERPDLDTRPIAVFGRLHRVADALRARLIEVYREFGLGEGEFDILATLRRSGDPCELTPGELASQTMVTSGAVSKRLDRLESAGLVRRRGHESDGRGRLVALTPEGRALIDEAFAAHMANEARLLAPLSDADRAALERILRAWGAHLEV
jgi:DNA-binding MarR family transcriptional regulator